MSKSKPTLMSKQNGFTLIEILVVIGLIAILAAIVLVSINPAKRFQDSRNSQRRANVEAILGAIQQNMVDNKGIFTCTGGVTLPSSLTEIKKSGGVDLAAPCLASYLGIMPVDPQTGTWTDSSSYSAGYRVMQDSTTKQVTIDAPQALNDGVALPGISVVR